MTDLPEPSDGTENPPDGGLAQLRELEQENVNTLRRLHSQGINVESSIFLSTQITAFIDYYLGELEVAGLPNLVRIHYEIKVQEKFRDILLSAGAQVRQSQLLQGVNMPTNSTQILHRG